MYDGAAWQEVSLTPGSDPESVFLPVYIETATVKEYPLFHYPDDETDTLEVDVWDELVLASGTATVTLKINSTAVTGLDTLSVTTTPQDNTATAALTISPGDNLILDVTVVGTPVDLSGTIRLIRTPV